MNQTVKQGISPLLDPAPGVDDEGYAGEPLQRGRDHRQPGSQGFGSEQVQRFADDAEDQPDVKTPEGGQPKTFMPVRSITI